MKAFWKQTCALLSNSVLFTGCTSQSARSSKVVGEAVLAASDQAIRVGVPSVVNPLADGMIIATLKKGVASSVVKNIISAFEMQLKVLGVSGKSCEVNAATLKLAFDKLKG